MIDRGLRPFACLRNRGLEAAIDGIPCLPSLGRNWMGLVQKMDVIWNLYPENCPVRHALTWSRYRLSRRRGGLYHAATVVVDERYVIAR